MAVPSAWQCVRKVWPRITLNIEYLCHVALSWVLTNDKQIVAALYVHEGVGELGELGGPGQQVGCQTHEVKPSIS